MVWLLLHRMGYMHQKLTITENKVSKSQSTLKSFGAALTQLHQHRTKSINQLWRHPDDNKDVWATELVALLDRERYYIDRETNIAMQHGVDAPSWAMIGFRQLIQPFVLPSISFAVIPEIDATSPSQLSSTSSSTPASTQSTGGRTWVYYVTSLLTLLYNRTVRTTVATIKSEAESDIKEVFDVAWAALTKYRLLYLPSVIERWFKRSLAPQHLSCIKSLSDEDLLHLGQNDAEQFINLVDM
jgi:hypothetical protein